MGMATVVPSILQVDRIGCKILWHPSSLVIVAVEEAAMLTTDRQNSGGSPEIRT